MSQTEQLDVEGLRFILEGLRDDLPVFFESIAPYVGMYQNIQPVYRVEEIDWHNGRNGVQRGVVIRAHYPGPLNQNLTVKTEA